MLLGLRAEVHAVLRVGWVPNHYREPLMILDPVDCLRLMGECRDRELETCPAKSCAGSSALVR